MVISGRQLIQYPSPGPSTQGTRVPLSWTNAGMTQETLPVQLGMGKDQLRTDVVAS